jgi:hypothetical protein
LSPVHVLQILSPVHVLQILSPVQSSLVQSMFYSMPDINQVGQFNTVIISKYNYLY